MIVVLGVERTVERIGEENGGEGDGHKDQEVVPFRSHPENAEKTCKNWAKRQAPKRHRTSASEVCNGLRSNFLRLPIRVLVSQDSILTLNKCK